MDQQPRTESEAAPPTSEQQGTLEERVSESATVEGNETVKKPHNRKRTIAVIAAISIVIIAICVFALTYCPHEWTDANCTSPKTCQKCGKTEGEPLGDEGHIWESATCTKPKTCSVCGKTEGTALGHKWEDQTYEKPKTCSRCGKTEGKSLKEETDDLIDDLKQDLKQSGEHKRYHVTVRSS